MFVSLLIFFISIHVIHSWPGGAPKSACISMAPNVRSHAALPQLLKDADIDRFGFQGPVELDFVLFDRLVPLHYYTL